jgi:hypothetical protein
MDEPFPSHKQESTLSLFIKPILRGGGNEMRSERKHLSQCNSASGLGFEKVIVGLGTECYNQLLTTDASLEMTLLSSRSGVSLVLTDRTNHRTNVTVAAGREGILQPSSTRGTSRTLTPEGEMKAY